MSKIICICTVILLVVALAAFPVAADGPVTLTPSTITWETYRYALNDDYSIVPSSFDATTTVERTFDTWIIENDYLKVTLLPEFGGRILSIIYKPTGHEQLYQNPLGTPYGIREGNFYYDWLMVYGGIFPTFPEPEHGKTWLLPWDFEVITESDEEITVAMSFTDEIDFRSTPPRFNVGVTGITCTFYITLKAGRTAVDTTVVLSNSGPDDVQYEYWTNVGLAPGSDLDDPRATASAEIIAQTEMIKMPPWWPPLLAQEEPAGSRDMYIFNNLRHFENWTEMGIAYAKPGMWDKNFWGVINHAHEEGFFRVADNSVTPGLKIWTFGYDSVNADPFVSGGEIRRPFIELWAGVTTEFWERTTFPAGDQFAIDATYSPSVGLTNVTHANEHFLANLFADDTQATLQLFSITPSTAMTVTLSLNSVTLYEKAFESDPVTGNYFTAELPTDSTGNLQFMITDATDAVLFDGSILITR